MRNLIITEYVRGTYPAEYRERMAGRVDVRTMFGGEER